MHDGRYGVADDRRQIADQGACRGARQFRFDQRLTTCERLAFGEGFAVCRVSSACERDMTFEAPPSDQPRLHLQYVDRGQCRFLYNRGDRTLPARSSRLFGGGAGGYAAWTVASETALDILSVDISEEWLAAWFGGRLPDTIGVLLGGGAGDGSLALRRGEAALARLALTLAREPAVAPLRFMAAEGAAMQAISDCLDALAGNPAEPPVTGEEARLVRVRERLLAPWDRPPTLSALAAEAGMSPRRLQRAFRERFGMSLFRMLLDIRLDRARDLLAAGSMSIKEVAWQAGYTHPANFTHAFRARFGVPPSAFLRRPEN